MKFFPGDRLDAGDQRVTTKITGTHAAINFFSGVIQIALYSVCRRTIGDLTENTRTVVTAYVNCRLQNVCGAVCSIVLSCGAKGCLQETHLRDMQDADYVSVHSTVRRVN